MECVNLVGRKPWTPRPPKSCLSAAPLTGTRSSRGCSRLAPTHAGTGSCEEYGPSVAVPATRCVSLQSSALKVLTCHRNAQSTPDGSKSPFSYASAIDLIRDQPLDFFSPVYNPLNASPPRPHQPPPHFSSLFHIHT